MARQSRAAPPAPFEPAKVAANYDRWLGRQPLAGRTTEAYRAQVGGYPGWLATQPTLIVVRNLGRFKRRGRCRPRLPGHTPSLLVLKQA